MQSAAGGLPPDLVMLERGWLSSNSLLMLDAAQGAVLVDTGYCTHKAQTLALVRGVLEEARQSLRLIVNTHLHADRCGGNAHVAAAFGGCPVWTPPGLDQAVQDWDEDALSLTPTGQQGERFTPSGLLRPGEHLAQGGRAWQILAAPGHDPDAVLLFDAASGVLLSADALWERGFGIVFPALDGVSGFDDVEQTLDLIAGLPVRFVVPGHGRGFSDVASALNVARARLTFFRQHPDRHARHAAKALLVFHLLEVGRCTRADLDTWLGATPIYQRIWQGHFAHQPWHRWVDTLLAELCAAGAVGVEGDGLRAR